MQLDVCNWGIATKDWDVSDDDDDGRQGGGRDKVFVLSHKIPPSNQ